MFFEDLTNRERWSNDASSKILNIDDTDGLWDHPYYGRLDGESYLQDHPYYSRLDSQSEMLK